MCVGTRTHTFNRSLNLTPTLILITRALTPFREHVNSRAELAGGELAGRELPARKFPCEPSP